MGVTITTARATLPELVDRVEAGDEIILTRHGKPVAVLVSPAALRTRRATDTLGEAADLGALLTKAKASGRLRPRLSPARAAELVADVDAGRDA